MSTDLPSPPTMRCFMYSVLLLAILVSASNASYSFVSSRVSSGLQFLYTFTEGAADPSSLETADQSGVNPMGNVTLSSDTTSALWSTGRAGLHLPGYGSQTRAVSANSVAVLISTLASSAAFSFELWFTPNASTANGMIVGIGPWAARAQEYGTCYQSSRDYNLAVYYTTLGISVDVLLKTSGTSYCVGSSSLTLSGSSAPYHIVVTFTSTSLKVYINAVQKTSTTISALSWSSWDTAMKLYFGQPLYRISGTTYTTTTWSGDIWLNAMYSRALISTEVITNYNAGVPRSVPVVTASQWQFAFRQQDSTYSYPSNGAVLAGLTIGYSNADSSATVFMYVRTVPSNGRLLTQVSGSYTEVTSGSLPHSVSAGQIFSYVPHTSWNGMDSFTMSATNGYFSGPTASVQIFVFAPPTVVDFFATVFGGDIASITLSAADTNSPVNASAMIVTVTALPVYGQLYQTPDGTTLGAIITSVPTVVTDTLFNVIYVNTGYDFAAAGNSLIANDTITYRASLEYFGTYIESEFSATVSVDVNNPFTANAATTYVYYDVSNSSTLSAITLTGSDQLNRPLSFVITALPLYGSLYLNSSASSLIVAAPVNLSSSIVYYAPQPYPYSNLGVASMLARIDTFSFSSSNGGALFSEPALFTVDATLSTLPYANCVRLAGLYSGQNFADRICDDHLLFLYTFEEGQRNSTVSYTADVSDVNSLGSLLLDTSATTAVSWIPQLAGLQFSGANSSIPLISTNNSAAIVHVLSSQRILSFSIEAWIQTDDPSQYCTVLALSPLNTVITATGDCSDGSDVALMEYATGYFGGFVNISDTCYSGAGPILATQAAQHIVFTVGISSFSFYVDGLFMSGGTNPAMSVGSWNMSSHLVFAPNLDNFAGTHTWTGIVFGVAMYSRALTADEVLANYNAGLPNNIPVLLTSSQHALANQSDNTVLNTTIVAIDSDVVLGNTAPWSQWTVSQYVIVYIGTLPDVSLGTLYYNDLTLGTSTALTSASLPFALPSDNSTYSLSFLNAPLSPSMINQPIIYSYASFSYYPYDGFAKGLNGTVYIDLLITALPSSSSSSTAPSSSSSSLGVSSSTEPSSSSSCDDPAFSSSSIVESLSISSEVPSSSSSISVTSSSSSSPQLSSSTAPSSSSSDAALFSSSSDVPSSSSSSAASSSASSTASSSSSSSSDYSSSSSSDMASSPSSSDAPSSASLSTAVSPSAQLSSSSVNTSSSSSSSAPSSSSSRSDAAFSSIVALSSSSSSVDSSSSSSGESSSSSSTASSSSSGPSSAAPISSSSSLVPPSSSSTAQLSLSSSGVSTSSSSAGPSSSFSSSPTPLSSSLTSQSSSSLNSAVPSSSSSTALDSGPLSSSSGMDSSSAGFSSSSSAPSSSSSSTVDAASSSSVAAPPTDSSSTSSATAVMDSSISSSSDTASSSSSSSTVTASSSFPAGAHSSTGSSSSSFSPSSSISAVATTAQPLSISSSTGAAQHSSSAASIASSSSASAGSNSCPDFPMCFTNLPSACYSPFFTRIEDNLALLFPFTEGESNRSTRITKDFSCNRVGSMRLGADSATWIGSEPGVTFSGSGSDSRLASSFTLASSISSLNVTGWTFELWLLPQSLTQVGVILGIGNTYSAHATQSDLSSLGTGDAFVLYQNGTTFEWRLQFHWQGGNTYAMSTAAPSAQTPHPYRRLLTVDSPTQSHLVLVVNGTANTITSYVNGAVAATINTTFDASVSDWFTGASHVQFAQTTNADSPLLTWQGNLNLFAVYTKSLSLPEILVNYNATLPPTVQQPPSHTSVSWSASHPQFTVTLVVNDGSNTSAVIVSVPVVGTLYEVDTVTTKTVILPSSLPYTVHCTPTTFEYDAPVSTTVIYTGSFSYVLRNPLAPDSSSNAGIVDWQVSPSITPPVASNATINVTARVSAIITLSGTDVDQSPPLFAPMTYIFISTLPVTGTLYQCNSDGSQGSQITQSTPVTDSQFRVVYVSSSGDLLKSTQPIIDTDSFTFTVETKNTLSVVPGVVSISVLSNVQVYDASVVLYDNNAVVLTLLGVDAVSESSAFAIITAPSHGTLSTVNGALSPLTSFNGTMVYKTSQDRFSGLYNRSVAPSTDSFTFAMTTPSGLLSVPGTVTLAFAPALGPPLLVADTLSDWNALPVSVMQNFSVSVDPTGLENPWTTVWLVDVTVSPSSAIIGANYSSANTYDSSLSMTTYQPQHVQFTGNANASNTLLAMITFMSSVADYYTVTVTVSNAQDTAIKSVLTQPARTMLSGDAGYNDRTQNTSLLPFNALWLWVTIALLVATLIAASLIRRYCFKKAPVEAAGAFTLTNDDLPVIAEGSEKCENGAEELEPKDTYDGTPRGGGAVIFMKAPKKSLASTNSINASVPVSGDVSTRKKSSSIFGFIFNRATDDKQQPIAAVKKQQPRKNKEFGEGDIVDDGTGTMAAVMPKAGKGHRVNGSKCFSSNDSAAGAVAAPKGMKVKLSLSDVEQMEGRFKSDATQPVGVSDTTENFGGTAMLHASQPLSLSLPLGDTQALSASSTLSVVQLEEAAAASQSQPQPSPLHVQSQSQLGRPVRILRLSTLQPNKSSTLNAPLTIDRPLSASPMSLSTRSTPGANSAAGVLASPRFHAQLELSLVPPMLRIDSNPNANKDSAESKENDSLNSSSSDERAGVGNNWPMMQRLNIRSKSMHFTRALDGDLSPSVNATDFNENKDSCSSAVLGHRRNHSGATASPRRGHQLVPVNPMVPVKLDSPRYDPLVYNTESRMQEVNPRSCVANRATAVAHARYASQFAKSVTRGHPLFAQSQPISPSAILDTEEVADELE